MRGLHAAGHEIGGHSLTHPNLRRLDEPQQRRQVCEDRRRLLRLATPVRSFAYPYDSRDAVTRRLVGECGYTSGRAVGGLRTGGPDDPCAQCPGAERLPASDPLVTRTPLAVRETWTLADLQRVVLAAERTGGWTQLVLHRVCDGCHLGVNPALLDRFAAWLARRADSHDTRVLPVGDVVTGPWWTHDDR